MLEITTYLSEAWRLAKSSIMPSKLKSNRKKCMTNTPNCHSTKLVIDFIVFSYAKYEQRHNIEISQAIPMGHIAFLIAHQTMQKFVSYIGNYICLRVPLCYPQLPDKSQGGKTKSTKESTAIKR